jgi:succinyl-diaminopimelate desuccinylase
MRAKYIFNLSSARDESTPEFDHGDAGQSLTSKSYTFSSLAFLAENSVPVYDSTKFRRQRVVQLAANLVRRPSVTPLDAGCQDLIRENLEPLGFDCQSLQYGEVTNLWARIGNTAPLIVFAGHTDVVPAGPAERWQIPPFEGRVVDGVLHGRGAADMKGSLAAMISAAEAYVRRHDQFGGSIGFLITSDEEGPAVDGTARVIQHLSECGTKIDYCVVGEPSSSRIAGDVIKVGRRGSLTGAIRINGRQGHIAYPHLAVNPIPLAARLIAALDEIEWDPGNTDFPPTSFQVSNVHAGTGVGNVIPGHVDILCNFRFSPESTPQTLKARVASCCETLALDAHIDWTLFGMPFQTHPGILVEAVRNSIRTVAGVETECSTTGGTSDGRFIAPSGAQVVELGPVNETIHRVDEQVAIDDLVRLSFIHEHILERILGASLVSGGGVVQKC